MDDSPKHSTAPQPESERDAHWMQCALALARQGVGLASPNPTVGCVLVREDKIVGRGFHQYAQRDHAEIVALAHAGEAARGATAYVTLEPCSHYGRTGPCARALMEAGIARVVAATTDPNPAVEGSGLALLRQAGIAVSVGDHQAEARELNDAFAHFIRSRTPLVTLKIAATLDGRIAPAALTSRASFPITDAVSRDRVQQLRHSSDALLTGVGTVLADDPLLTDRSHCPRRRPLLRIVLDSQLRIPLDSRMLKSVNDDLLIVTRSPDRTQHQMLADRGARLLIVETQSEGGISLRALLEQLGAQDITSLLIEGGARLNRSALVANIVDKLALFLAPRFLGPDAVPMLAGPNGGTLPSLQRYRVERLNEDLLIEGYLRDPWEQVASSL